MKLSVYRFVFVTLLVVSFGLLGKTAALAQGCPAGAGQEGPGPGGGMPPPPFAMGGGSGPDGPFRPGAGAGGGPAMFFKSGPGMMPPLPFGGGPGMFPPHPPGMGGPMMLPLEGLDLSEEQEEKIADLKADTMDKAAPIMSRAHSIERQCRAALVQPVVNREQVGKLQSQLSEQKQALDAVFNGSALAQAQILTAEQRKVLRQKINQEEIGNIHFQKRVAEAHK